jgi:hypothetical protein
MACRKITSRTAAVPPFEKDAFVTNRIHIVRVPDSLENSDWVVVAPDAETAARLYVAGVIDDVLSVDSGEMAAAGVLEVDLVHMEATGEPRVIEWDSDEIRIIHGLRSTPLETEEVALDGFEEWIAHIEDVGLEP